MSDSKETKSVEETIVRSVFAAHKKMVAEIYNIDATLPDNDFYSQLALQWEQQVKDVEARGVLPLPRTSREELLSFLDPSDP